MSKLIGMNPRMTPLTMCPGTQAYMPPEALITPPRYSNKLDCFSHGVLTIQIITRQFPNPGDAHKYVQIPGYSSGRVLVQFPERERRKKDIDLVSPNHPLLPLALHCLKDDDTERPSADELCGRLATLKGEQMYTRSVEQSREQSVSVQTLQQQIRERDGELARARISHQQQVQDELSLARANYQVELNSYRMKLQKKCDELNNKESEMEQVIADCHARVQTHESANEQLRKEIRELRQKQKVLQADTQMPIKATGQVSYSTLAYNITSQTCANCTQSYSTKQ